MFDVLTREVAVRFNLGDKALPLLQMLLACMTQPDTGGGLPGFLEKLKAAGLGPAVQSWLGGGPSAKAVTASQIENALGNAGGLLEQLTARLDAPRDNVAGALGYLLPYIVGKLTPGGSLPSSLPAEITSLASAGQTLLSAPLPRSGGCCSMKWLWPAVAVAAAAVLGLSYCHSGGAGSGHDTPAPASQAQPAENPQTSRQAPPQTAGKADEGAAEKEAGETAEKTAELPMPSSPAATEEAPAAAETAQPPAEEKQNSENQAGT